jgi:hypothetical protein
VTPTPPPPGPDDEEPDAPLPQATERDGLPRWWRSQPLGLWWGLPIGLTVAVWLLVQGQVRLFGYVVAGTLAAAALVRLLLPRDAVGGLMVRSRFWDVVTLLALAAGTVVLAATLNLPG